jgi:hypothetical protein
MISEHNTFGQNGYNMTVGGRGMMGRVKSKEEKRKSSEWHLRFRHTEESKQLMRVKFTNIHGCRVNQYTLDGAYIATFDSCKQAAESLGAVGSSSSISRLCAGSFTKHRQASVKGYQWKYYNNNISNIAPAPNLKADRNQQLGSRAKMGARKVQQLTLQNDHVKIHTTVKSASIEIGTSITCIYGCCNGTLITAAGFKWKWC